MAIKLVTRSEWGARKPKGSHTRLSSTKGVKVHYTGGAVNKAMIDDHSRCAVAVRGIQNGHMDGNGWIDIGYSMVVCYHGYVFVGRGPHKLPAANGAGLNSGHYAVLGLVGTKGIVTPSDAMLHGIRDAIEYLREKGNAGKEIKGHKDGYATSCPGAKLYAWVKKGAPRPDGSGGGEDTPPKPPPKPKPPKPGEKAPPFPLPSGHWFGPESPDPRNHSGYWAADRPGIRKIRDRLRERGWSVSKGDRYDKALAGVIRKFQAEKDLDVDGLTGPITWKALWEAPIT